MCRYNINIKTCESYGASSVKLNRACYHWNYLLIYWKFPIILIQNSVNSDWLCNTQSRALQADWFILEINEQTTFNINMPYYIPLFFVKGFDKANLEPCCVNVQSAMLQRESHHAKIENSFLF